MSDSAKIDSLLVCGAGTMGSWIGREAERAGFQVTLYDPDVNRLQAAGSADSEGRQAGSLRLINELNPEALDVDLVIECITERVDLKNALFRSLEDGCPDRTILTSNTSILDPESFLPEEIRRDRFACFHFYRPGTAVEIMPVAGTSATTVAALHGVAVRMGEVPVQLRKSSPGYLLPAMMGAAVDVALGKVADGVASPDDVDRVWMAVTGTEIGPLGTLDLVGIDTSLLIRKQRLYRGLGDERLLKAGIGVLEKMVSEGRLGMKSGHGFYAYPNPAYTRPEFLGRP